MRILQLNSARLYVGEAAHTLNLTEALRRRGHSVWLGLRKNHDTLQRAAARDLHPIGFNMPHRWWPPQDLPDLHRMARLVRAEKIDLIHAHRGKEHWQAVLAAKLYRLNVPVIRTRHVVTPLKNHAANRWLARRTAALVAVSKAVEKDVAGSGMYADGGLAFIPGGIDTDLFMPAHPRQKLEIRTRLKIAADAPVAFCVARFAVVKAHRVLLPAWKIVQERLPAARLVLIGGGRLQAPHEEMARTLGIAESVIFLGRRQDVPELLHAADIGVLSSVGSEGFSRAVLEYMAKGLPVVGTRVGAVPDLVEDGVTGRLVPPEDERALGQSMLELLTAPPAQRVEWGRTARLRVEGGYGFDSWAKQHEDLYQRTLEKHRSAH